MIKKLGPAPVRGPSPGAELTSQRAAVLELVQHSAISLTSSQVADGLGLHHNTAREHLDALVERDLIHRMSSTPSGRGRPALRYSAAVQVEPNSNVREYSGLVAALATHIEQTSRDPAQEALEAGTTWGVTTADRIQPEVRDGKAAIVAQLSSLGFQPKPDPAGTKVALLRCPLLDAAKRNPEIVCNVHLGLVRGMLEVIDSEDVSADLDAFAVPGACILHVERDVDEASQRPATINREEATRR